jgi:Glycosyltransferase family 6
MGSIMIAVVLIATGGLRYTQYVSPLIKSLKEFFPPCDVLLFTDSNESFDAIKVPTTNLGWPRASLMRYHMMSAQKQLLLKYSHVFYLDVDMLVVRKVETSEICGDGITAVVHPGFPICFERRSESCAAVIGNPIYYQGCLIGGSTKAFLEMCYDIGRSIDVDDLNNIMAVWFDESHMNRYLTDHPPVISLSPAWCWPGGGYIQFAYRWTNEEVKPVIRHLEKPGQESWK